MVIGADVYVMAKKTYSVPTRDRTGVLFPGVSDILNGIQKSVEMRLTKIQSECGCSTLNRQDEISLVLRKPVFGFSDQVRYKPGCTATEDG